METFLQYVGSLGFPIVFCFALGFFIYKIWDKNDTQQEKREAKYIEQIDNFTIMMDKFNKTLLSIDCRLETMDRRLEKVEDKLDA